LRATKGSELGMPPREPSRGNLKALFERRNMGIPNNKTIQESDPSVMLTVGQLKALIREEIEQAQGQNGQGEDRLLDAEEASKLLSVSPDWLYRHSSRLPFTRKLGPKMLRFSCQGLQKWLTTRKNC